MNARRISKTQLACLRQSLPPRDLAILRTLQSCRLASARQLRRMHIPGPSPASSQRIANRCLKRLNDKDLVHRLDRRVGGIRAGSASYVYTLAPLGHRMLGQQQRKRAHEPSLHHVAHTLAITELAAQLIEATRTSQTRIEQLEFEPKAWRTYSSGAYEQVIKPDLRVQLGNDQLQAAWMIEVDRATESSTVLNRKLLAHVRYFDSGTEPTIQPRVLWVVPHQKRADQIARLIDEISAPEGLFAVTTDQDARSLLMNLGD